MNNQSEMKIGIYIYIYNRFRQNNKRNNIDNIDIQDLQRFGKSGCPLGKPLQDMVPDGI